MSTVFDRLKITAEDLADNYNVAGCPVEARPFYEKLCNKAKFLEYHENNKVIGYGTTSGHKWEFVVLFDKKFNDYDIMEFLNGSLQGSGPFAKNGIMLDAAISNYLENNKKYSKISFKYYRFK